MRLYLTLIICVGYVIFYYTIFGCNMECTRLVNDTVLFKTVAMADTFLYLKYGQPSIILGQINQFPTLYHVLIYICFNCAFELSELPSPLQCSG
jgi:hypothetical protein